MNETFFLKSMEFSRKELEEILHSKLGYTGINNYSFSGNIYYINLDNKSLLLMYNTNENREILNAYRNIEYNDNFDSTNKLKFIRKIDNREDNLVTAYTENGNYTSLAEASLLLMVEDRSVKILDEPDLHFEPYKDYFAVIDSSNKIRRSMPVGELMDTLYTLCTPIPGIVIRNNNINLLDRFKNGEITNNEISFYMEQLLNFTISNDYVLISSLPLQTYDVKTFIFYFLPLDTTKEALFSYGDKVEFYKENNRLYVKLNGDVVIPLRYKIPSPISARSSAAVSDISFTLWIRGSSSLPINAKIASLTSGDNKIILGENKIYLSDIVISLSSLNRNEDLMANKWYFFAISYKGINGLFEYLIRDEDNAYEHYATTTLTDDDRNLFNNTFFESSHKYSIDDIYSDEEQILHEYYTKDGLINIWNEHKGDDIFTINEVNEIGVSFDTKFSKIHVFKKEIVTTSTFADQYPSHESLSDKIQIGRLSSDNNTTNHSFVGTMFFSNKIARVFNQFTAIRTGFHRIERTLDLDDIPENNVPTNRLLSIDDNNFIFRINKTYADISGLSDLQLKKNIENLNYSLSDIIKLRPVNFNWKDDKSSNKNIGLIAQETEKIIPEVVTTSNIGYKNINYNFLIPILINSVKELKNEVEELRRILN